MRLAGYNTITLEGLQRLVRHMLELQRNHARLLERENSVLCDFINREMKMTGNDPRIAELAKRIAALSNDGAEARAKQPSQTEKGKYGK